MSVELYGLSCLGARTRVRTPLKESWLALPVPGASHHGKRWRAARARL